MNHSTGSWLGYPDEAIEQQLETVFIGRPSLDDEAFYDCYYRGSAIRKDIVCGVRRAFLESLMFDLHRLAPGDSFKAELGFVWTFDSLEDVELICQIEKQFGIHITDVDAQAIASMGDLIELVDRKMNAGAAPYTDRLCPASLWG